MVEGTINPILHPLHALLLDLNPKLPLFFISCRGHLGAPAMSFSCKPQSQETVPGLHLPTGLEGKVRDGSFPVMFSSHLE